MAMRPLLRGIAVSLLVFANVSLADDRQTGRLKCTVTDERGAAIPSRVYLIDSAGHAVLPEGMPAYKRRGASVEEHFLASGPFDVPAVRGAYTLRIERGLEWTSHEERVSLEAGKTTELNIVLHRWLDMNSKGWFSGDTHIHRDPRDLELLLAVEDLNFGANLPYWNDKDEFQKPGLTVPESAMKSYSPSRAACVAGQEIERLGNGWGAVLFMGEFKPVLSPNDTFHPLDVALCQDVRKQGAYVDIEKPVWLTTPICTALGEVDSIGVVHNHFHPRGFLPMKLIRNCIIAPSSLDMGPRACAVWTLDLYYHLLNCGLRIAASAGTASGVMPAPAGFERTYVKLDGPFSGDAWLKALKAGKSFGTNGPILDLKVAGKSIGDVLQLEKSESKLHVSASAISQHPLEVLEVIYNGVVVGTQRATADLKEIKLEQDLNAGNGWLAIRAFGPETATQIFAQSSPVYLEFNGDRGCVASSGTFYRDVIDELLTRIEKDNLFPDPYQKEEARLTLNKARDFYNSVIGR